MAKNRVIGRDNDLPWHIPEDLKYFKAMTLGKPVIMGRKTFESLGGKPLPGRANIIISRSNYSAGDLPVFTDVSAAIEHARKSAIGTGVKEIMILGGAQIYELALPLTDRLYLTEIERDYEGDTFFPTFNATDWRETARTHHEGDPAFSFVTYDRVKR